MLLLLISVQEDSERWPLNAESTRPTTMVPNNRLTILLIWSYLSCMFFPVVDSFILLARGDRRIYKPTNSALVCPPSPSRTANTVMFLSSSNESDTTTKQKQCGAGTTTTTRKKRALYSFSEARKIARGHGFSTTDEFLEYDCAGAYQLPKNADEVWADDWTSWEDFLGLPFRDFEEAREIARAFAVKWKVSTEEEYLEIFRSKQVEDGDIASRLPFRPDQKYENQGWISWEDFLSAE